jgi:hypothetical protein
LFVVKDNKDSYHQNFKINVRKTFFYANIIQQYHRERGVNYLIENHTGFFKIDLSTKKKILDLLQIEHRFLQSFDMIYIPDFVGKEINGDEIETYLEDMVLVELKTTKNIYPIIPKVSFLAPRRTNLILEKYWEKNSDFAL